VEQTRHAPHRKPTTNSTYIVACVYDTTFMRRLLCHFLAKGMFTELFPSNGSLLISRFWLSADMPQYASVVCGCHSLLLFILVIVVQICSNISLIRDRESSDTYTSEVDFTNRQVELNCGREQQQAACYEYVVLERQEKTRGHKYL
jgi:hypothetical protein